MKGKQSELKIFSIITLIVLYAAAFLCGNPLETIRGLGKIVLSRDALITDYFELAGYGSAFLNAALVLTVCLLLLYVEKIPFTGPTMAALFINIGYGLWGKNIINILPILLGTWIYARMHHQKLGRYIYVALFGTCLAPFVTEMVYLLPYSGWFNLSVSVVIGIFIGFVLPPLSAHTASMHMGYNLFNVGFSAGILAFVLVCVFRSFGLESQSVLIWKSGRPVLLAVVLYLYFAAAVIWGYFLSGKKLDNLHNIFQRPGRAITDFVLMEGVGATLMNMGLIGTMALTYILAVGGDLSGPVVGAIFMAFGFGAFGAHVKNYWPVLAGVLISTLFTNYTPVTPGIQLAAVFAVGLAPIAGQFGIFPGILSGMLHSAIVMCTASMYGGLNLYNNGFSAGWVAIFMVPTVESFMKHFEYRRNYRNSRREEK